MKKTASILLTFIMLFSVAYSAPDLDAAVEKSVQYINSAVPSPNVSSIGGEWAVTALARSGAENQQEFFGKYYDNLVKKLTEKNGVLHDRKYTEYSRVILAVTAIGKNAENVSGYNLITPLCGFDNTVWQGINGAIWALIALDSGNYISENTEIRGKYIEKIISEQNPDGGWSLSGTGASDTDLTAMALTALAKYKNDEKISTAVNSAVEFLSNSQNENGGFSTYGTETSESVSQVIIALCALKIPQNDARFVKNGKTPYDNLMTYYDGNGGFYHDTDKSGSNQMASEQAFCALVSLKRFNENLCSIYDMTDIKKQDENANNTGLSGKNPDINVPGFSENRTFSDIIGNSAQNEIEALASRKIINGKTDDIFAPDMPVTRAEFSALITRALGLVKAENVKNFDDVLADDWFFTPISVCANYGIVKGISDTEFNPNGFITNQETAVMLERAAKICGLENDISQDGARDILAVFEDYTASSNWAQNALAFCYKNDIFSDDTDLINPQNNAARGEIAVRIYNLLKTAKLI